MATRLNDGPIQDIQLMLQSVTDIATRLFINSAMYTDIYRLVSTSKTWKISRNDLDYQQLIVGNIIRDGIVTKCNW